MRSPGFAWNHGDIQDEIANTWAACVGPGIENTAIDSTAWTDHTDLRPTILTLLGLHDDYQTTGAWSSEIAAMRSAAVSLRVHHRASSASATPTSS